MRVVLDTDVMVAAIRSNLGASRRLLAGGLTKQFTLLASVPLLIEYQAVMTRLEHLQASRLTAREMRVILDAVASVAEPVRLSFLWRPVLRDPNDDMVLETAINGRADYLVTFNQRDFGMAVKHFSVTVLPPREALIQLGLLS